MQPSSRNLLELNLWISNVSAACESSWQGTLHRFGLAVNWGGLANLSEFKARAGARGSASVGDAVLGTCSQVDLGLPLARCRGDRSSAGTVRSIVDDREEG